MLLSGSLTGLSQDTYVRATGELLNRLPLSLLIANERLQAGESQNVAVNVVYEYSMASCRVIFHHFLQIFDVLFGHAGFQKLWLRYLGVLATNLNMLARGSNMHNDLLDKVAALLQLLKVPSYARPKKAKKTVAEQLSVDPSALTPGGSKGQDKGTGWLAWLTGGEEPIRPEDTAVRPSESTEPVTVAPEAASEDDQGASEEWQVVAVQDDRYGKLLLASWRATLALYPNFAVHLRVKHPLLATNIAQYVEHVSKESKTDVIPVQSQSQSETTDIAKGDDAY